MNHPLVSIGIPTFNGGRRIAKAIDSIIGQSYENYEVVISDNASEDDTEQVCRAYSRQNDRISYYQQKTNVGAWQNFNAVKDKATGKYFMWLSDDDELGDGILGRYVQFMEKNKEYALVSGKINYWQNGKLRYVEQNLNFEADNNLWRVLSYYAKVVEGALFYGLMRLEDVKPISLKRNTIGSDWHLVANLAYKGRIKQLDFTSYNKHSGGLSSQWKNYAAVVEAPRFYAQYPYVGMASDAFRDIMNSHIYHQENLIYRAVIASLSFMIILVNYYFKIYPRIIGGRVKRFVRFA